MKKQRTNEVVVICPRCKGRKQVFDWISLFLTVGLPVALLLDSGEDEGITKKDCPTCGGDGVLKLSI